MLFIKNRKEKDIETWEVKNVKDIVWCVYGTKKTILKQLDIQQAGGIWKEKQKPKNITSW